MQNLLDTTFYRSDLSKEMKNLIRGPEIEVYSYVNKKFINAFTVLTANSKEDFFYELGSIWSVLSYMYIPFYEFNHLLYKRGSAITNSDLIIRNGYAELTKVPYIPIMYEKSLETSLSQREIISIFLHECGHHTQWREALTSAGISYPIRVANWILRMEMLLNIDFVLANPLFFVIPLCVCIVSTKIYEQTLSQDIEYNSDNVAIALGYGNDLASGLTKLYKLIDKNGVPSIIKSQIMIIVNNILGIINSHPEIHERLEHAQQSAISKEDFANKLQSDPLISSLNNVCGKFALTLKSVNLM